MAPGFASIWCVEPHHLVFVQKSDLINVPQWKTPTADNDGDVCNVGDDGGGYNEDYDC